jgi:hypothetical protein
MAIPTIASVLVCGCASPPKTIDEFHTGNYVVEEICAELTAEQAYMLLYEKLVQCYQNETDGPLLMRSSTEVEKQALDNGTYQLALAGKANWNRFYQQLIEIRSHDDCPASVAVWEISPGWKKHTDRIRAWLKGVEATGCGLW